MVGDVFVSGAMTLTPLDKLARRFSIRLFGEAQPLAGEALRRTIRHRVKIRISKISYPASLRRGIPLRRR